MLLADSAILGGFVFSPAFDVSGNPIPDSEQYVRTNDSETNPSIILRGDGSGHLAKENILWDEDGNIIITGEYKSAESGKRIVINPDNGNIRMYDSSDRVLIDLDDTYNGDTPAISLYKYSGTSTTADWIGHYSATSMVIRRTSDDKDLFYVAYDLNGHVSIISDLLATDRDDVSIGEWYRDGETLKVRTS